MRFLISKTLLLSLMGHLQNVVSQRAQIPILANVLVEAANDELILTATDLTVAMRCFTEVKVLEEGATTLPAKRLFQLIRELPEVNVEMQAVSDAVTQIRAGASRFRLHGMNRQEFPAFPDLTGAIQCQLRRGHLRDLLYRTAFAASKEESRYVLTGILAKIQSGILTFIGTDGKRLAKSTYKLDIDPSFKRSYILPLKAVEEVIRMAGEGDEPATLYLMEDRVAFECGQALLVTKLLSGEYPEVSQVIPTQSEMVVTLHREELISLLRQVSLFTGEGSQSARFTFEPGELTLTANTLEVGEGKVSMPVDYSSERFEIAFNPSYFHEILRHLPNHETFSLSWTDPFNPGVIRPGLSAASSPEGLEDLFLLMPMRLNDQG